MGARTRISALKAFNDIRTGARTRISALKAFNDNRTGARCEQNPGEWRVHYAGTGQSGGTTACALNASSAVSTS